MDQNCVKNEFEVDAFALYYRELSDTFIDIKKAASSLKKLIGKEEQIFEVGLGIGYFAEQFLGDGYSVVGIQPPPPDKMLIILKRDYPATILAEKKIEDYEFDRQYNVIVSHSSVFLFTRVEDGIYKNVGSVDSPVFQSFIDKALAIENLRKILSALSPTGRFFVNIQTNPLPFSEVGPSNDRFRFEMVRCEYSLHQGKVQKIFRTTCIKDGKPETPQVMPETHYCLRYSKFMELLESVGGDCEISDDNQWVILKKL